MGFKGSIDGRSQAYLRLEEPAFCVPLCAKPEPETSFTGLYKLSDDISLRFSNSTWSEYPLFADTYMDWIAAVPEEEQVINIFMELCALGMFQPLSSNILEFLKALPACAKARGISFSTPSEVIDHHKSVDALGSTLPYVVG